MMISLFLVALGLISNAEEYSCVEVGKIRTSIQQDFLAYQSSEVAHNANKKKALDKKFQLYLDEDQLMQKIKQIDIDGTSGTALSVISMAQDVTGDFQEKSDKLFSSLHFYTKTEVVSQEAVLLGAALLIIATMAPQRDKSGLVAGGMGFLTIGGAGSIYSSRQKRSLPVHIKTINTMEEKWANTFRVINDKKIIDKK